MSRKRTSKPNPRPSGDVITVTKKLAAISQLESAILLWFNYGDPLPILALADAAGDCYNAMGAQIGAPGFFREWLKVQSQAFQDQARYVQNFIKHGWKDLKGSVRYSPKYGEVLMMEAVDSHKRLFGGLTPIMAAFSVRFVFENPSLATPELRAFYNEARDVYHKPNKTISASHKGSLQEITAGHQQPAASKLRT